MPDDPRTSQPQPPYDEAKPQPRPGLDAAMAPLADHGEESYRGKGLLEGMAALITGGDSGIGRAVAIAYAREGADVAISYLEAEQADAEATADWVRRAGRRALLLPGDLRDEALCRSLVARTVAAFGRLDVLVNNAAAQVVNEGLDDVTTSDIEGSFRANVFAMIFLAQEAARVMKPGASIINTTSQQSKVASAGMLVYSATKGVIVKDAEKLAELGKGTPLGRAGQPAELAGAYVLLASREGSYMTGALIPVTGGQPML